MARLDRRLMRVGHLVGQLGSASPAARRVNRRLSRAILRLVHAERIATRVGCEMGTFPQEVDVFVRQFAAYRQALAAR
jgi:hypothetical protein